MIFSIDHLLRYRYSRHVFLEPHVIRLRPRASLYQRPERFELDLSPAPAGSTELEDEEGNLVTRAWFEGTTDTLEIRARMVVHTLVSNPFDYVVADAGFLRLPMEYGTRALDRYAGRPRSAAVRAYVSEQAGSDAQTFVHELTARISADFVHEIRDTGEPRAAGTTLRRGKGACRDLSVLFIECCRSTGLAARFVSGYHEGTEGEERHLHAWAEVFLPGAGWRGFDPTLGLAVADRHVALAAAAAAGAAAAVEGSFRGTGAASALEPLIEMRISS